MSPPHRPTSFPASWSCSASRSRRASTDNRCCRRCAARRLLDLDRRYERALTLTGDRNYREAAALLQSVIADRPDFTVAYLNLASVYLAGGDPRSAVALLERAAERGITTSELRGRLGS